MVRKEIDVNKPLTDAQIAMLQALADRPDEPDADCPELTEVQLSQFRRVAEQKREERRKQTVTLRLSPQALKKAKSHRSCWDRWAGDFPSTPCLSNNPLHNKKHPWDSSQGCHLPHWLPYFLL